MSATLLYRIASVLLILFAAGHTYGFLNFKPPTAEGLAVRDGMNRVQFQVGGQTFSYGGFYDGFGLTITVYLLFAAYLAWHLGGVAARSPQAIGALGWVFVAMQAVCLVLSVKYFSVVPSVLSGLLTGCLAWAAWIV